jgi:hypothetical protein
MKEVAFDRGGLGERRRMQEVVWGWMDDRRERERRREKGGRKEIHCPRSSLILRGKS